MANRTKTEKSNNNDKLTSIKLSRSYMDNVIKVERELAEKKAEKKAVEAELKEKQEYKNETYNDINNHNTDNKKDKAIALTYLLKNDQMKFKGNDDYPIELTEEQVIELEPMILKWGSGYKPILYPLFEDKYQRLSLSFQLPTESHKEFLIKACVCSVKADNAMANDNVKEAKEWMNMFATISQAGKLQPSQISKADLQHGMDTFSQLVKMVEESVDIVPILPQFIEKPQDSVDFTILCFVNYVRKLQGMAPVEHKEIYDFYEVKRKELEIHQKNMGETGD